MDTQLKKKIVEDLKKTGFGSEMKVMQILAANNWRSSGGTGFFDKDEKITREIDVTAYRPLFYKLSSEATFRCFFHLSIEVKKSKVPWIVFKQELRDNDTLDAWNNVIFVANLPDDSSIFTQALSTASLLIKNRWKGTGIHESFKPPNHNSLWYSAFAKVCKASENELIANSRFSKQKQVVSPDIYKHPPVLYFFQPVVVLDGLLCAATLSQNGEIEISEVPAAAFTFDFKTESYGRVGGYRVDLVTLNWLPDYIELCEQRHNDIYQEILKAGNVSIDNPI